MINSESTIKNYRSLLIGIVFIAAVLRFALAPQLSIESRGDVLLFQFWGYSANAYGLVNVYQHEIDNPYFKHIALPNYLPPYLVILQGLSWVHAHFEPSATVGTPLASVIFKTPAILVELFTILLLGSILRRRAGPAWGLLGAGVYALHPAITYTTAGWGQVDAFSALGMVLCVLALERRRYLWAVVAWTAAFFFKMQVLAILPLLLWEVFQNTPWRTWLRAFSSGLLTAIVLTAPFLFTGRIADVTHVIFGVAGQYPHPSANAYNFWWLFSGGHWVARSDLTTFLGLPLLRWGAVMFFAGVAFALWFRHRVRTADGLWLTAAFLALAFFMLPTEMHERYLFPFFALLLPVLPHFRPARWLFGILTFTFTWNLIVVFITLSQDATNAPLENFWGGSFIIALVNVLVLAATIVWFVQMARHRKLT